MTWREKLQNVMDERGVTQYRLSAETGLRQSRISLWLNGKGEPSLDEWGMMCRVLDVPVTYFLPDGSGVLLDQRTSEEQMLIRVAKKVGVQAIWELIAEAAVAHSKVSPPPPGPLPSVRDITKDAKPQDGEDDAAQGPGTRRQPKGKR